MQNNLVTPFMKLKLITAALLLGLYSCRNTTTKQEEQATAPKAVNQWQPPAAGSVVAKQEQRITEDNLNESYFRVSIISTDSSKAGFYNLKLEYGYNINEVPIGLPAWTGNTVLKPLLQQGSGRYHCLVGFDAGDNRFRELYEVTVVNGNVKFKQTHGYYSDKGTTP